MKRPETFGEALRVALKRAGRSQSWLAEILDVRPATVSAWAQDDALPSGEHMVRLPELLRVSGHYLLTQEGPMGYDPDADAIKLEVIGMVYNEEVDALALKQYAAAVHARGIKRDDVAAQVETEAPVRSGGARPREREGNDGPSGGGPPEDPSTENTNGPPNTKRHAGP